jgi:3'-5' exoribonuclease
MMNELLACIRKIKDSDFQKLLHSIFDPSELKKKFRRAPAAKGMHHACVGGLMEHTLSLFRLCESVAPHFPEIDTDLLLTGVLVHDLGKVDELSYVKKFDYTDRGRLMGHIALELDRLSEAIRGLPGFPEQKTVLLKHLILSHHGKEEFGSPVKPMTLEALILHMLDDLDAKTEAFRGLMRESQDGNWSPYHSILGQFVFKGFQDADSSVEAEKAPSPPEEDEGHPTLF